MRWRKSYEGKDRYVFGLVLPFCETGRTRNGESRIGENRKSQQTTSEVLWWLKRKGAEAAGVNQKGGMLGQLGGKSRLFDSVNT